jgi:thiol-disulfide isomerase/thioredoxin
VNTFRLVMCFVAAASIAWIPMHASAQDTTASSQVVSTPLRRALDAMPTLDGAVEWLNSKPLTAASLRGKVVLIDFWTYSCINWQRTLPHVRAWADKYKDQGLVVIGVHSPEFGFEKDLGKVREATGQLNVGFPVAVDSAHAIWNAFSNAYWPALYLVDARGTIRYRHFGEGEYERSEKMIQQLLTEAGAKDVGSGLVHVEGAGSQAEADWANLRSPETYIGSERTENFASPGGMSERQGRVYMAPDHLRLNTWALAGDWATGSEAATLQQANGRIVYRFHARDLHLVMGPAMSGKPVPFRVLLDGKPPGAAHGADVDADGRGTLVEHRLYQLIRQPPPVGDRQFEIQFLGPGVEAYSFTFG